jgi:tetratricopeptide (TPR) repeat protein
MKSLNKIILSAIIIFIVNGVVVFSANTSKDISPDRAMKALSAGNYSEALKDFDILISQYNLSPKFYYGRGIVYYYTEKYDDAISDFTQAIYLDSTYLDAYLGLTNSLMLTSAQASAVIKVINKALLIDSKNSEFYYLRGLQSYRSKEYEKAIDDYTSALKYSPYYANAIYGRAISYYQFNNMFAAKVDFDAYLLLEDRDEVLSNECKRFLSVINNP